MSAKVDADDSVPLVASHLVRERITEDTREVSDAINASELRDSILNEFLRIVESRDITKERYRGAARVLDGVNRLLRGFFTRPLAVDGRAEIVDDNGRTE